MKKYLAFACGGDYYVASKEGFIMQRERFETFMRKGKSPVFSGKWKLLGTSIHHWRNGIDRKFEELFAAGWDGGS